RLGGKMLRKAARVTGVMEGAYQKDYISDDMKFQLEMELHLPKFFALEWDCSKDYPCEQIYPTEEMLKEARNKAKEPWRSKNK
ncbi:MAG: hypothetical protein UHU19_09655, partial [Lachnospiraceae bacterium]|nr:hypothetical protein [Lachnospiraceae bacterium]